MATTNKRQSLSEEGVYASITTANLSEEMCRLIDDDANVKKEIRKCAWLHPFSVIIFSLFVGMFVCFLLLTNYEISIERAVSDAIKHQTGVTVTPR